MAQRITSLPNFEKDIFKDIYISIYNFLSILIIIFFRKCVQHILVASVVFLCRWSSGDLEYYGSGTAY